ncbi:hypothetical protein NDU88_006494 [Pleurodeles waltl]|uniref:Uncharacterized protein n=1 Tax=Pleurodeles waltl TaxID=8319 RepID=A0AAV7X0U0_PLEWA|nr:hypothetical protein NDU88_006494 [Pleurodeles waltl]
MGAHSLPVRATPQAIQPLPDAPQLPPNSRSNACRQAPSPHHPLELTSRPSQGLPQTHECTGPIQLWAAPTQRAEAQSRQSQQVRNLSTVGPTIRPFTPA